MHRAPKLCHWSCFLCNLPETLLCMNKHRFAHFLKYSGLRLTNEEQENFCDALWASPSTQIYLPPSPALGESGTDSYALHFPGRSESAGFLLSLTEHGELEGTRKGKEKSALSPSLSASGSIFSSCCNFSVPLAPAGQAHHSSI